VSAMDSKGAVRAKLVAEREATIDDLLPGPSALLEDEVRWRARGSHAAGVVAWISRGGMYNATPPPHYTAALSSVRRPQLRSRHANTAESARHAGLL